MSTNCTSTARPANVSKEALHPGNLFAIFSIQVSKSPLLSFLSEIGSPKLVVGKLAVLHYSVLFTSSNTPSPHCMGITQLFCRLICSPEASPKQRRMSFVSCKSSSVGLINRATSSQYNESLCPVDRRGESNPSASALRNRLFRTSITKINSIGERGSPWRRPR